MEPLRLMVQGLPGAGKSQVIKWVRSFFEDVLGWEHAREFICIVKRGWAVTVQGYSVPVEVVFKTATNDAPSSEKQL